MNMQNFYNPDVLSCLANLSNDEVFTPPDLVNAMLDTLPANLWQNKEAKFLDPVCKSGVFLREIAKRLLKGLEKAIPNKEKRIAHIFKNQLYGIAITELTSLMSRRSVYCSKDANSKYSVCNFPDEQGNIRYERLQHSFQNGKCTCCGANESVYGLEKRDETLETYAYNFIHLISSTDGGKEVEDNKTANKKLNEILNMKFDVIIGNPPYQLSDGSGGSSDAAMPIYNRFVEQAIKLNPTNLIMIIPSKWMVGGRGLDTFRENMMNDQHIKYLFDFENSADCFQGLHIDSGVCYFLWNKNHNGKLEYSYKRNDGTINKSIQFLKNDFSDYVIRDQRISSIIEKSSNGKRFSEIVSSRKPFGIETDLFNNLERYPESKFSDTKFNNSVKVYGVKGIKGGARRIEGYVTQSFITSSQKAINQYKLFFSKTYSTGAVNFPEVIIGDKGEVCTSTFLMIGTFENKNELENCLTYMHTAFFKILLYFGKGTMNVTQSVFQLIPLQDFSESWTDEKLYSKYGLDEQEIAFIESMIRPME